MNYPLKLNSYFSNWMLRQKLFCLVGVFVVLIAIVGLLATGGIRKVYRLSYPLAQTTYPTARAIVDTLHSIQQSRAFVIQYALEKDATKLSFFKKQFETENRNVESHFLEIDQFSSLPEKIRKAWAALKEIQKKFLAEGMLLMEAHEDQLRLVSEREAKINDANHIIDQLVETLNAISDRAQSGFQLWNIAAQVVLLEQRFLYQASLSTPLSMTPEQSEREAQRLELGKERFRNYMGEFNTTLSHLEKALPSKEKKVIQTLREGYVRLVERVQGEEGIFLIAEDEAQRLSTIGLKLEALESLHHSSSTLSNEVETYVSIQMKEAAQSILGLKSQSHRNIFGFTFLCLMVGIAFWVVVANNILRPIEHLRKTSERIKAGSLSERVQQFSQDEIGHLASSFNQMIDIIEENMDEIKGLNEKLESKVGERTRELAEANLKLLRASEMKSELLSNVSHDLKTPLNSILGFTQIVLTEGQKSLTSKQRENLDRVISNGKDLLRQINTILEFSKIEAGHTEVSTEEFLFEALLDECLEITLGLIDGKHIRLIKEIQTHLPRLKTDRPRLKRILMNLLSNATKFTTSGHIKVSVESADHSLRFSVEDTGEGIPRDRLLTLFEPYYSINPEERAQKKASGTGLGLSITKNFVNLLGGTIDVMSSLGKGTTFRVTLPTEYQKRTQKLKKVA